MRALRVVGLADGGKTVICEDPARGERFTLPADERLRAAARGDVTRLGQIEIELESQMRPREIQARIRAGESVEQVAEAAGIPTAKVERFAYPVLLERSRTAELAQRAHPVREDGPDLQTLGEICLHVFTLRGQDYTAAVWDSWRGEDGRWIVQLCWTAGRSVNRAHWAFHPGAHGGTVTPLDEHAHDLLDPQPARPLRTVRPVTELAQAALNIDPTLLPPRPEPAALEASSLEVSAVDAPAPPPREPYVREPHVREQAPYVREQAREPYVQEPVREQAGDPQPPAYDPVAELDAAEPTPREPEPTAEPAAVDPADYVEDFELTTPAEPPTQPTAADQTALIDEPARKSEPPRRAKGKKTRPIVPSWEDVLLGTRSNRG
ncbi:septation protein SepH [Actinokineospora sp. NPDC004072]